MASTQDFHSGERFVETEGGGVVLAVALLVIVLCGCSCFCYCRRRRMKDDEHRMYIHYLERLRAGELPNALIDDDSNGNQRRRRSSATRPDPVDTSSQQQQQRRQSHVEDHSRASFVQSHDVEAPMAEAVVLSSSFSRSPASDPRRSSRVYGSSRSPKPQYQPDYDDAVDDRRLSINALAELAALESALEESQDEHALRSALAGSQAVQEEESLRQVMEESHFVHAQEVAAWESEETFAQSAIAESEAQEADRQQLRQATDDSILVNNPMRPSHVVERMMDELGERVSRRSVDSSRHLSPTSSRESLGRQYRVFQNGAVADRVMMTRSRSRQSTNGGSNNNMHLDLNDDVHYTGGPPRRPRGRQSI